MVTCTPLAEAVEVAVPWGRAANVGRREGAEVTTGASRGTDTSGDDAEEGDGGDEDGLHIDGKK